MTNQTAVEEITVRIKSFLEETGLARSPLVDNVSRAGGGTSTENWAFDATTVESGTTVVRKLLVRRDPLMSVVDTGRKAEYELLDVLGDAPVRSPKAVHLDNEGRWFDRPAMVLERSPGTTSREMLTKKDPLSLTPPGQLAVAKQMCDELATLHAIDIDSLGVENVLSPPIVSPALDEIRIWSGELAKQRLEPQPALEFALAWMRENVPPAPDRLVLVHGDFRPANFLVADGSISAVLDWELARIGDPIDDLGWYFASVYAKEHFIPGQWEHSDFITRYEQSSETQVDLAALDFWRVMAMFRLSIMALTGIRIFCEGTTSRPTATADWLTSATLRDTFTTLTATNTQEDRHAPQSS